MGGGFAEREKEKEGEGEIGYYFLKVIKIYDLNDAAPHLPKLFTFYYLLLSLSPPLSLSLSLWGILRTFNGSLFSFYDLQSVHILFPA